MAAGLPAPHGWLVIKLRSGTERGALSRVGVSRHWGGATWPGGVTWRRGRAWVLDNARVWWEMDDNERADRMVAGLISRWDPDRGPYQLWLA